MMSCVRRLFQLVIAAGRRTSRTAPRAISDREPGRGLFLQPSASPHGHTSTQGTTTTNGTRPPLRHSPHRVRSPSSPFYAHSLTRRPCTDVSDVAAGAAPTTLFQSTRPTSAPSSPGSTTGSTPLSRTIRIIIGVAAGAGFLLGALLIAFFIRRRRAPAPMTTVIYTSANPSQGIKYEPVNTAIPQSGYYDPNYRGYTPSVCGLFFFRVWHGVC